MPTASAMSRVVVPRKPRVPKQRAASRRIWARRSSALLRARGGDLAAAVRAAAIGTSKRLLTKPTGSGQTPLRVGCAPMAAADADTPQLEAARALAPELAARAAEAEAARRLPPDVAARLADAGVFAVCVPARYGGAELAARDVLRLFEELARADGAAGWCAMIGATTGLLAGSLPERFAREIYGNNPRAITGGAGAMSGRARAVAGGHVVSG